MDIDLDFRVTTPLEVSVRRVSAGEFVGTKTEKEQFWIVGGESWETAHQSDYSSTIVCARRLAVLFFALDFL